MTETKSFVEKKWKNYCWQIVLDILRHPIEYAKVLIQVGYEPLPPTMTTSLFGTPIMVYPNVFAYILHIQQVDGVLGCYNGLWLKLVGNLLSAITTDALSTCLNINKLDNSDYLPEIFYEDLKHNIFILIVAIIISEPFHLITVRKMCQFVGKETIYNELFYSISEIYDSGGVFGFYAGLMPRLIGDVLNLILCSILVYCLHKYLLGQQSGIRKITKSAVNVFTESIMYPFRVVAKCMSVNGSGLVVGMPPYMPCYVTWLECWVDLSHRGQLKRGGSMFFRYAGKELQYNSQ